MTAQPSKSLIGFAGVPAAETALSHIEGLRGELIIAGKHVAELTTQSSLKGVMTQLWSVASAESVAEAEVRAHLGQARISLPDLKTRRPKPGKSSSQTK